MTDSMKRVLIANRGEIALRILRSLHTMGLEGVAVYADSDAQSLHVRDADLAFPIGPPPSAESYLRIDAVIEAARRSHCQAIHPGYGFLSERGDFARAVEEAGLIFIGPQPENVDRFGNKVAAREALRDVGISPVPGSQGSVRDEDELESLVAAIGFPLMLKATGGGGGKGIRIVREAGELAAAWATARSEARNSFGSDAMFVERYLERSRHVEIQVLGDGRGGVLLFRERDCSTQRRLQKILEETPSPVMSADMRERLLSAVATTMSKNRYRSAGTLEFLLAEDGEVYFLEMNTRIQVEHPITEVTTGVDLVGEQLEIAGGKSLPPWRGDLDAVVVPSRGAAVEFRVNAEDPTRDWLPSTGTVTSLRWPSGPGIRVDSALEVGTVVTPYYDSLLAKVIAYGANRRAALARLRCALRECVIGGLVTNLPLGLALGSDPGLLEGKNHCQYLAERMRDPEFFPGTLGPDELALAAAAAAWLWREGSKGGAVDPSRDGARNGSLQVDAASRGQWRLEPGQCLPYWCESP